MAGGSDSALQTARPLLQTLSDTDKLYLVPGGVGAGSNMKMMHQVLAAIHMLGASEVMGFAAHLGLDARETAEKVLGSGAWTWMLENRFPRMVEEDWNPGASALTIMVKDVVCSFYCFMMVGGTNNVGHHHNLRTPKPLPDSPCLHCRASLPDGFVAGLRRQRRLGSSPSILSPPHRQRLLHSWPGRQIRSRPTRARPITRNQSCRCCRGSWVCAPSPG